MNIPPPAAWAVLPEKVLLVTVSVPTLAIPPPVPREILPEKVLLATVSVPLLAIPLPSSDELPEKVLLVTVNVPPLRIPPPGSVISFPAVITRPLSAAVTPVLILKTCTAL